MLRNKSSSSLRSAISGKGKGSKTSSSSSSSLSTTAVTTTTTNSAVNDYTFLPDGPQLLSHHFMHERVHLIDVHPVRPWILTADRSQNHIRLFDYEQKTELLGIYLETLLDRRKREIEQLKVLDRNYRGIEFPQWYTQLERRGTLADYCTDSVDKIMKNLGELRSVRLFDEDIVLWRLAYEREHTRDMDDDDDGDDGRHRQHHQRRQQHQQQRDYENEYEYSHVAPAVVQTQSVADAKNMKAVIRRIGLSGAAAEESGGKSDGSLAAETTLATTPTDLDPAKGTPVSYSSLMRKMKPIPYAIRKTPRFVVLHFANRVLMLRYDDTQHIHLFVDEVKHTQLDNKHIVSLEFIYTHPLVALGGSDGCIRLWNYADRSVLPTKINAHSKSVGKMLIIHRDDPLNALPSLLSCGSDGSLCSWNLDKGIAEFEVSKAHDTGSIVDISLDAERGIITTLGSDRSVVQWTTSGRKIRSFTPSTKIGSTRSIARVHFASCVPSWLAITSNSTNLYFIASNLAEKSWNESVTVMSLLEKQQAQLEKLNAKELSKGVFFVAQAHPLRPNMLFVGSSFGLFVIKLDVLCSADGNRMPPVAVGIIPAAEITTVSPMAGGDGDIGTLPQPSMMLQHTIGNTNSLASPSASGNQRAMYYTYGSSVFRRTVTSNSGLMKNTYTEGVEVMKLSRTGNVQLSLSPSGHYICVYWESTLDFEVFNTSTWKLIASGSRVYDLVWSLNEDRFAIVKGNAASSSSKSISIFELKNNSVVAIHQDIHHGATAIFGGYLLGISESAGTQGEGLYFFTWDGERITDQPLPQPTAIKWDALTLKCVITFQESYAVFSYIPEFKMTCYVKERVENAMWWNGTLFTITEQEMKCIFPMKSAAENVVLASFDTLQYAGFSKSSEENSLDPIPQPRPRGSISLVSVIDDDLYVIDGDSILYCVSLDHAALKFRMLVTAGRVDQALEWLPYIPEEIHDQLASFMAEMSYEQEACRLETISASKKLALCMQYHMVEEAFHTVRFIDQEYKSFLLTSQQVSKLYLRLASVCARGDRPDHNELAAKSYLRASVLDPQHFNSYISFLSSRDEPHFANLLQQLKVDLAAYHGNRTDSRMYNEQMSLLCMLLASKADDEEQRQELHNQSSQHLVAAQQYGLANLSLSTPAPVLSLDRWNEWLLSKYSKSHVPFTMCEK